MQVPGYSTTVPTRTSQNSSNINTYYRCTIVIQDKPKTRFGKWIHGVLAYYIHFVNLNTKKLQTAALNINIFNK